MLRKVVDNTSSRVAPTPREGINWYQVKLKALEAKRAASPYIRGPIMFALGAVFYTAFLLLMWLRPLVQVVLRLVAGLTLLGLVVGFFVVPEHQRHVLWILGGTSFAAFLLAWFYDWVVLRLSPEPIGLLD